MMAGNPNPSSWWSMHNTPDLMIRSSPTAASDHHHHHQAAVVDHDHNHNHAPLPNFLSQTHPNSNSSLFPLHEYLSSSSNSKSSSSSSPPSSSPSSFLPLNSFPHHHHHHHHQQQQQQQQIPHDFPHSWSQLLLGGLGSDQEEKYGANMFQSTRSDVKQEEISQRNTTNNGNNNDLYGYNNDHEEQEAGISNRLAIIPPPTAAWSSQNIPISSPRSCVTTLSSNSNMLDFSITNKRSLQPQTTTTHQHADHSNSECNSSGSGGVPKKPRVQSSSNPPLKVRKEKLGDRITALHQLVSPFGKTDTASVLLEAIGYIRFLQAQIQALSSPYLGNNNNNAAVKNQYSDDMDAPKGLRNRGLCLVPTSCTHLVGNDNGADYWAQIQSLGGGF